MNRQEAIIALLLHLVVADTSLCESDSQVHSQKLLQRVAKQGLTVNVDTSYPRGFFSVSNSGGRMSATKDPFESCGETPGYFPSPLEKRFKTEIPKLTNSVANLCKGLENATDQWIQMNMDETAVPPETPEIFSQICPRGASQQVIEPLAGVLRDPRMFCPDASLETLMSVDWLVLADNISYPSLDNQSLRLFFDAGGSNFQDATQFFVTKYAERGIEFDQIFVWDAELRDASEYWEGTPEDVRAKWEPRLHWYNGIPVTTEKHDLQNPVHRIRQLCGKHDFCAFKLDIDTPSVEYPLVLQLIDDPGNLKEFFFEHHVENVLMSSIWLHDVNGSFQDSYDLFTALRQKGVRAHSWI